VGVDKKNGFRAPYRSLTFRNQADTIITRNGILSMEDDVYESGGDIKIPPYVFTQEGLLVEVDIETSVNIPPDITSPYYLTVNAITSAQTDDLSYQFAKAPGDVSPTEVIIAEYDGGEWRHLPFVSIDAQIRYHEQNNIDLEKIGPQQGLFTTFSGGNFNNSPGVVHDSQGLKTVLDEEFVTPPVADDPDGWERVDRMIYRRHADDEHRIGVRKYVVGGNYTTGIETLHLTSFLTASPGDPLTFVRTLINDNNEALIFISEGYGNTFEVKYTKYSSDRTSVVEALTPLVSSNSQYFDVGLDPNGEIQIAFVAGNNEEIHWSS